MLMYKIHITPIHKTQSFCKNYLGGIPLIIQIFYKNILKECFFHNVLDGRYEIHLYSYETGLNEDIIFFIDFNNGIRRINGHFSAITGKDGKKYSDNIINEDNMILLTLKTVMTK